MPERGVLVVTETPSLGRSVLELLDAAGVPAREVDGTAREFRLAPEPGAGRFPVLISACNEPHCETVRRWRAGELPPTDLVVIGARDATLISEGRLHVVRLPLDPGKFLSLIHRLRESSGSAEDPVLTEGRTCPLPSGSTGPTTARHLTMVPATGQLHGSP